ncbi:hypothetical protein [Nonomuraea sp. NPDC003754]
MAFPASKEPIIVMADVRSVQVHLQHYDRHLAQLEELRRLLHDQLAALTPATGGRTSRADRQVADIEAALDRMDRERYGVCTDCASFIPYEQLLRAPHRLACDGCAVPPQREASA